MRRRQIELAQQAGRVVGHVGERVVGGAPGAGQQLAHRRRGARHVRRVARRRGCRSAPRESRRRRAALQNSSCQPSICTAEAHHEQRASGRERSPNVLIGRASCPARHRRIARSRPSDSTGPAARIGAMAATRQSSGAPVAAPAAAEQEIARLSIDTIRASRWTPSRRPTPAIRGRRWRSRRSATCCSRAFLNVNPADTSWPDRDRFVLSAGHACVLQYSLLPPVRLGPLARGPQAVPPVGLAHPGHPERGLRPRRRGHHRPARSGLRQRGRDGDRRALPRPSASTAPRARSSTTART